MKHLLRQGVVHAFAVYFQHGAYRGPAAALKILVVYVAQVAAVAAGKQAHGLNQEVIERVAVGQQLGQYYFDAQVERLAAQVGQQAVNGGRFGHGAGQEKSTNGRTSGPLRVNLRPRQAMG